MEKKTPDWTVEGRSNPGLLLVAEVAKRLRASESFVYQAISEGRMRHLRLGKGQGAIRVTEEMLAQFIRDCERGPDEGETTYL